MKKYTTKQSDIKGAGKGLFTKAPFKKGEVIGLAHVDDQPYSEIGHNHNHNEENPTAFSKKINNKRYIFALRDLKPGEEITTNYRLQPELEQPEDFEKKKGGLVSLPKDKPEKSKKFSRSLDATNRLYTENNLFKKPKSRKNKVFDPHAKYYAEGGDYEEAELTPEEIEAYRAEGYTVDDNEYQDGDDIDAMNGMMKARLAYANEFGNPAAKRMINLPDTPYQFDNGDTGTHYMASMDNYAVPQIQDENGQLMLGDYGPESNEAMRFDSDEDANYFAENYKDVSPGFLNKKKKGGALLTKKVICKKCGWKWDAADGGNDITTCHKCGGKGLMNAQQGGGLNKFQEGGSNDCGEFMVWDDETQQCVKNTIQPVDQVRMTQYTPYQVAYDQMHPREREITQKKAEYLNKHKGLNRRAGVNQDNFPEKVLRNIENKIDYERNNYVIDQYAKAKKFNPNKHVDLVENMAEKGRGSYDMAQNSKYGSKLKPSLWSRTLAGAQELGNFIVKQLPGEQGDVFKYKVPGLSKKEAKEIAKSKTGALETFAVGTLPGQAIANAVLESGKTLTGGTGADYKTKDIPNVVSGEYMPGVDDGIATVLNPLTYTGLTTGLIGAPKIAASVLNMSKGAKNLVKGATNYGNDIIQTSKQAGKLELPKYSNTYRVEHAGFNAPSSADNLTGRWFANNPKEAQFYASKLKDPVTGDVIPFGQKSPVRIMRERLPEYKIKEQFGAGMPEEARTMSMGRGDFTDAGLDDLLGSGAGDRFTKGKYIDSDYNAMESAPFLFRQEEGILGANRVNQLRAGTNQGRFSSGNTSTLNNQLDAINHLLNEQKIIDSQSIIKKFLPFKDGGSLDKFVGGGSNDCPGGSEWDEELQGCFCVDGKVWEAEEKRCVKVQSFPSVRTNQYTKYINEWEEMHPEQDEMSQKKYEYLQKAPGLNRALGVTKDNINEKVLRNIAREVDRERNNYVLTQYAKDNGFNPNDHVQLVENIAERGPFGYDMAQNSKYGSKLAPSLWARSLAGVQELGNFIVKQLPGEQGDVFKYQVPGLSKKERKEIANSKTGALETASILNLPGQVIANQVAKYVKPIFGGTGADARDQEDTPDVLSGQYIPGVDDRAATLLNPLTYTGLTSGLIGGPNILRTALPVAKNVFNKTLDAADYVNKFNLSKAKSLISTPKINYLNKPSVFKDVVNNTELGQLLAVNGLTNAAIGAKDNIYDILSGNTNKNTYKDLAFNVLNAGISGSKFSPFLANLKPVQNFRNSYGLTESGYKAATGTDNLKDDFSLIKSLGLFKRKEGGPNNNYIETELTPEEIEEYRRGGFTVEEIY